MRSAQEAISVLKHEHPGQHWGEPERSQLPPLVLLAAPSVGLGLTSKTHGGRGGEDKREDIVCFSSLG